MEPDAATRGSVDVAAPAGSVSRRTSGVRCAVMGETATDATAMGATAMGAMAIGAMAIGTRAIGTRAMALARKETRKARSRVAKRGGMGPRDYAPEADAW